MSNENLSETNSRYDRIHLFGYDANSLKNLGIKIIEGRLPESSNEIVLSDAGANRLKKGINIGDELEITFEGKTKKYTLVGITKEMEKDSINELIKTSNYEDNWEGITFLDNKELSQDILVNVKILTYNIKQIYRTTNSIKEYLKLDEIQNINKDTDININDIQDRSHIEFVENALLQTGLSTDDLKSNNETNEPIEKLNYNKELLEYMRSI